MGQVAKLEMKHVRPRWKHHCDVCDFLGRIDGVDLYFCHHASAPSTGGLVIRDGHDMGDFSMTPYRNVYSARAAFEGTKFSLAFILYHRAASRGFSVNEYRTAGPLSP